MRIVGRLRVVSLLLLGALALVLSGGPIPATGEAQPATGTAAEFEPGTILVAFSTASDASALSANSRDTVIRSYGGTLVRTIPSIDVDVVSVPEGRELEIARALNRDSRVRYAEPNYLVWAHLTPNDTFYYLQWAHPKISSPAAWDTTTGSSAVTVAVIDTGVELADPEFQGRLVTGYDFANNDADPNDDHGHGTHVAGIIGAAGNNGAGVAGMAWQTKIMPVKVLTSGGTGSHQATAQGIVYAVDHGADLINISLGGPSSSTTLYDAIRYAYDHGVLVVASAGNCGDETTYTANGCTYQDQPIYPAAYDTEVFAVAATESNDATASFSNRGSYLDIAAPGYYILSTYLGSNTYVYMYGTSQAAPFVSGLAALLLAVDPTLTAQELQTQIETMSLDLGPTGWDVDYGAGRINAQAAVESVLVLPAPTLNPIGSPDYDGTYWVDWSDTLYATSYTLEEADNPAFLSPIIRYSGSASTALVTGRPFGVWYYRVRAERVSASKVSPWSNVESVQVGLATPVLEPIANSGSSAYNVVWQTVSGATGYRLQESPDLAFTAPVTRYLGTNTSYSVTGQAGGTWHYRVQAYNSGGNSDWSVTQSTTVLPLAPVLNPITLIPPDAYTLTWTATTGATSYRLQESADLAFTAPITRYVGISTSYAITGQPGGTWYYRVEAHNQAGFGPPSNTEGVTVTASGVPAPVLSPIDYGISASNYTVAWTAVQSATYTLEESRSVYFEAPAIAYAGALTSYQAIDQGAGPWHYRVRAHTVAGSSPWSNVESVPAFVYLPLVVRDGAAPTP
jgi:subtilisin family serine protease